MTGPRVRVSAYAASDVGLTREINEDSYHVGVHLFALADGMGGHVAGEVASDLAIQAVAPVDELEFASPQDAQRALTDALKQANRWVVDKSAAETSFRGMGTTLTAVLVRDGYLHLAHVGDSRAYLLRHDEPISQLTTDHTLVERLVQEGRLSRDEAAQHPQRNVITRAVGNEPDLKVDQLTPLELRPGDQVLLCSDGLTDFVSDGDIRAILEDIPAGDQAVASLIDAANDAGGRDNITVVLLRVTAAGQAGPGHQGTAAVAGGGDHTQDLAANGSQAADAVTKIRTREDAGDRDWAKTMGRLGAHQGVEHRPPSGHERTSRTRRVFATLLAVAVLVGVFVGGGWFLLSRAYFVGVYDSQVAIYHGLPQELAGIPLNWVIPDEISDLQLETLPEFRQRGLRAGLPAGTLTEARAIVSNLEESIEQDPSVTPTGAPEPTETPGGARAPGASPSPGSTP